MESELGWKEAIIKVLREANAPMHYVSISDKITEQGLRTGETATPANTVAATIAQSFKNDGSASPFIRVERGVYRLREMDKQQPQVAQEIAQRELSETESSDVTGVINAFGMFWDRSKVIWETEPQLLGQHPGAKPVNFGGQKGVYLLHDSQGVVYVGRTSEQSMGRRLQQHTSDRLTGRWTRFSWFGVYPVEPDGTLRASADFSRIDINTVIATMEAVLVEGLEPRQNRKRGDAEFQAIEFLQYEDPTLVRNRKLAVIQEIASQLK